MRSPRRAGPPEARSLDPCVTANCDAWKFPELNHCNFAVLPQLAPPGEQANSESSNKLIFCLSQPAKLSASVDTTLPPFETEKPPASPASSSQRLPAVRAGKRLEDHLFQSSCFSDEKMEI